MSHSHHEVSLNSESTAQAAQSLREGSFVGVGRLGAGPRVGVFLLAVVLVVVSVAFGSNEDSSSSPTTNIHEVLHQ